MGVKDRLLLYLKSNNISKNSFYKEVNVSNGYLDKQSAVNSDVLARVIKKYNELNYKWLLLGEGEMIETPNQADPFTPTCAESCQLKDYIIQLQKEKIRSLEK
jgi:hypothetical protein